MEVRRCNHMSGWIGVDSIAALSEAAWFLLSAYLKSKYSFNQVVDNHQLCFSTARSLLSSILYVQGPPHYRVSHHEQQSTEHRSLVNFTRCLPNLPTQINLQQTHRTNLLLPRNLVSYQVTEEPSPKRYLVPQQNRPQNSVQHFVGICQATTISPTKTKTWE